MPFKNEDDLRAWKKKRNPNRYPELAPREIKNITPQIRHRSAVVARNIKTIDPEHEGDPEPKRKQYHERHRTKYSAMRAHMESAAVVIAAGGTYDMAAAQAGINQRQVRKYMSDADFRARVNELREQMLGKVKGRIIQEFENRTDPEKIKHLEIIDLTRIFDRTTGDATGKAESPGEIKYDQIIQQIFIDNSSTESVDFPEYGDDELQISDGDSPG